MGKDAARQSPPNDATIWMRLESMSEVGGEQIKIRA
jgi:hypothetical protein